MPYPSSVALSSASDSIRPGASSDTSLPCNDFFGMTYSDIGAKSRRARRDANEDVEGEGPRRREAERDLERESSAPREEEVIRFSGTWCKTVGPSLGSKVA